MPTLVSIASALLVLAGLHLASSVMVPVILAIGLAVAFQPIGAWVKRRRLPAVVTALLTVLVVTAVMAAAGLVLVAAFGDLATGLPTYQKIATAWLADLQHWLRAHNLAAISAAVGKIEPGAQIGGAVANSAAVVGNVLQTIAFVVLLTVFIQLEAGSFPARLRAVLGAQRSRESVERTLDALADIQRYILVKIAASFIRALIVGLLCYALGVEQALLWSVLAFALNFVPVLGPLAAAAPPVATAAITLGTGTAVLLAGILLIVGIVFGSIIEPRVTGRVVGLSPLVVILALTLWGFVLGPIGALLAVPLTMVVKLALEEDPKYGWLAKILAYRPLPGVAILKQHDERTAA